MAEGALLRGRDSRPRNPVGAAATGLLAVAVITVLWMGGGAAAATAAPRYSPPACPRLTYRSVPALHAQRACMNTGVLTHGTKSSTYLFLTPGATGAGIYEDNGDLVWWKPSASLPKPGQIGGDYNLTVVRFQGQPYLAVWSGRNGTGSVALYNQHYQQVGQVTSASPYPPDDVDLHEFQITPQGDALIGVSAGVSMTVDGHAETVVQYVVQKLSLVRDSHGIHTGRVLFQWASLSDVPVSQSRVPDPGKGGTWDYFHGNAISQDTDGNLLVSARNTWGIYEIDDTSGTAGFGHVIWEVGAKRDHTLAKPWCYQHDIAPLGNGRYSLFDDGGTGPGCVAGSTQHPAQGLIITVDPSLHPAGVRLIAAYSHTPAIYTNYTGSTQQQGNGNVLIDWADVPEITEYSADGQTDMDLSLSSWSYRGYRFAWDGQPTTSPALAAQTGRSGTQLWASWNGSTEVTGWQVLAGSTAAHLEAVGKAVPKTGFQTAMSLNARYAAVAVQALNAGGKVLSTSHTITPTATQTKAKPASATTPRRADKVVAKAGSGSAFARTLRMGDRGAEVKTLQLWLSKVGYRVPATGYFGSITRAAVQRFQEAHHLKPDGVVGDQTARALLAGVVKTAVQPRIVATAAKATTDPIPGFAIGRDDMGVDATAGTGAPIYAPSASRLVQVVRNWYAGQPLLLFEFDNPPAGALSDYWYVAEQIDPVTTTIGTNFAAGQKVASFALRGTGIEIGWGSPTSNARTLADVTDPGAANPPPSSTTIWGESFKKAFGIP